MITYDTFEKELQEGLGRMFDPDYRPSVEFCQRLGCQPSEGNVAVRNKILLMIERLKPPAGTQPTTITRLVYDILYNRYSLKHTQEETAYRINVSRRTINRLQRVAVHNLCGLLWEQGQSALQNNESHSLEEHTSNVVEKKHPVQTMDWNAQLQQELNFLETKAPKALSNLKDVITDTLSIMSAAEESSEVRIQALSIQPDLVAAVHPVLLEQVIISTLKRLALVTSSKEITIFAKLEDGNAKITLTCACGSTEWNENDLIKEIPVSKDMSIEIAKVRQQVFLWIVMPLEGKLTMLVVDDNEDMVQFYRDCTIGTRYHIIHLAEGRDLYRTVRETPPDIIILDVMLPDTDGWRLLMRLHEDPETRQIPVLVCSVIREENLALSLGAAGFLSKPVSPRLFIQTLEQIQPQVAAKGPTTPESSEESD